MIFDRITIQLSDAKGTEKGEYCQLMSSDVVSLNIVLVAKEFVIKDDRPKKKPRP